MGLMATSSLCATPPRSLSPRGTPHPPGTGCTSRSPPTPPRPHRHRSLRYVLLKTTPPVPHPFFSRFRTADNRALHRVSGGASVQRRAQHATSLQVPSTSGHADLLTIAAALRSTSAHPADALAVASAAAPGDRLHCLPPAPPPSSALRATRSASAPRRGPGGPPTRTKPSRPPRSSDTHLAVDGGGLAGADALRDRAPRAPGGGGFARPEAAGSAAFSALQPPP
jgi:hypothetical protein